MMIFTILRTSWFILWTSNVDCSLFFCSTNIKPTTEIFLRPSWPDTDLNKSKEITSSQEKSGEGRGLHSVADFPRPCSPQKGRGEALGDLQKGDSILFAR